MTVPADRPIGRLLRLAQVADPQQVVETMSMAVAELGGDDTVLYLVDYDHSCLTPHPDVLPHGEEMGVANVEGSVVGRVFVSAQPLAIERDDGWRVWVPVTERAQKLGVLCMRVPSWDERILEFCVELGVAAAHLVSTANGYTDRLTVLRRRKPMSLAAELQWGILPPVTFEIDGTTIAGLLEPAYEVGGDCFDYSLNGNILDLAIFDSMGHGLNSATLGSLAVSAYRNSRRESRPADLRTLHRAVDAVIGDFAQGGSFLTALFAQLDITTGRLRWASFGHPEPIHVRRGKTLALLQHRSAPPLGLYRMAANKAFDVVEVSLEPGDGLLLYTDGVVEARDSNAQLFGEQRLQDLLERESTSGHEPAEVLRRLVRLVLEHSPEGLRDDASTMFLRWDHAAQFRR